MATIVGLYQKVTQLDTDKAIDIAFSNNTHSFGEAQKAQLYAGKTVDGEEIAPHYRSFKYARVKNSVNPSPGLGVPDLKFSGRFYNGIRVEYAEFVLKIASTDEKNDMLTKKYPGIWGLGGPFKWEWVDKHLEPEFHKEITAQTGLKFSK